MARSVFFQAESVDFKGKLGLAIVKYLRDTDGSLERATGGLWVWLDGDRDSILARLTNAAEQAMAFAVACESKHAEILRSSEAPKAPKAQGCDKCGWTTSTDAPHASYCTGKVRDLDVPAPKAPAPPKAPAQATAPAPVPVAPTPAPKAPVAPVAKTPDREKIIAKAREDRAKLATNGVAHVGSTTRDTGRSAAPVLSAADEAEQAWLRQLGDI